MRAARGVTYTYAPLSSIASHREKAREMPSMFDVPLPSSSTMMSDRGVMLLRIYAASLISERNVERLCSDRKVIARVTRIDKLTSRQEYPGRPCCQCETAVCRVLAESPVAPARSSLSAP